MRRRLALALLAGLVLALPAHGQDSTETEQRKRLEDIRRQAAENREKAKTLRGKENAALGQLRRTDRELSLTRRRLRQLANRRENLDTQLEITHVNLQHATESLSERRARLSHRLREIYKFGPAQEMEYLLSTESFAQLLTRWDFLIMVAEQDRTLLEDVRARKGEVETLEGRLKSHLDEVDRTAHQTSSQNAKLARQRSERASVVQEIHTQRESYEAAAAQLEQTARDIQRLLAQLERRRREEAERAKASGRPAPQPYTGDFAKAEGALDWPVTGSVIGHFGHETGKWGTEIINNGIDISVPVGTAVHAVAKARVEYTSGDYGSYGQIVLLNHGDGYYTLYAYLSEIAVSVGQEVASGAVVGRSGESALKGAILHFEVRRGASALNPESWLR